MSNQHERVEIGKLLLSEWKDFATILDERGETWLTTDPMRWPASSALHSIDRAIRCLLAAAKIVGLEIDRAALEREHRAIQKYKRMFPDGPPSLADVVKARPPAA